MSGPSMSQAPTAGPDTSQRNNCQCCGKKFRLWRQQLNQFSGKPRPSRGFHVMDETGLFCTRTCALRFAVGSLRGNKLPAKTVANDPTDCGTGVRDLGLVGSSDERPPAEARQVSRADYLRAERDRLAARCAALEKAAEPLTNALDDRGLREDITRGMRPHEAESLVVAMRNLRAALSATVEAQQP